MEGKIMTVLKYLMFFFNFLFWLSGLALIIVGAIIRKKYGEQFNFINTSELSNAPILLIVVGVIIFIIGFLGCCGSIKENYCMVTTFAVLLCVVFILEIVAGALAFAYRDRARQVALQALDQAKAKYGNEKGPTKFVDWIQQTLQCCGATNYTTDWVGKNGTCGDASVNGLPSCHRGNDCADILYTRGCQTELVDVLQKNMVLVGGIGVGFAVIQLLGIVFACMLMRAIKEEYEVV